MRLCVSAHFIRSPASVAHLDWTLIAIIWKLQIVKCGNQTHYQQLDYLGSRHWRLPSSVPKGDEHVLPPQSVWSPSTRETVPSGVDVFGPASQTYCQIFYRHVLWALASSAALCSCKMTVSVWNKWRSSPSFPQGCKRPLQATCSLDFVHLQSSQLWSITVKLFAE